MSPPVVDLPSSKPMLYVRIGANLRKEGEWNKVRKQRPTRGGYVQVEKGGSSFA